MGGGGDLSSSAQGGFSEEVKFEPKNEMEPSWKECSKQRNCTYKGPGVRNWCVGGGWRREEKRVVGGEIREAGGVGSGSGRSWCRISLDCFLGTAGNQGRILSRGARERSSSRPIVQGLLSAHRQVKLKFKWLTILMMTTLPLCKYSPT